MRAYPSAAPLHTPSNRPSTARIRGSRSSAFTSAISVVPGFAKQTSTPAAAAVRKTASAPVIKVSFGVERRAEVSYQRQEPGTDVVLEQIRVELECSAAAPDDQGFASVARIEWRRDRIDVTAPVSQCEAEAVLLVVAEGLLEALSRERPLIGALQPDLFQDGLALVLRRRADIRAAQRRRHDGHSRSDVDDERAGVPVRVDHLHVQAVVDGQVNGGVRLLRQRVQQGPRGAADVDLRQRGVPQAHRRAAQRVLARRVRMAKEAELRERIDEARDRRSREARPGGDLLVREPTIARSEAAQHIQTTSERGDELAVGRGCQSGFRRVTAYPRHGTQFRMTK